MTEILGGEIGPPFGSIPVFTDCAMPSNRFLIGAATDTQGILEGNRGLPHTCEDKRCSRWILEQQ